MRLLRTLSESTDFSESAPVNSIGIDFLKKLFSNVEEFSSLLPEAVYELSKAWDEITETMICGCLEPDGNGVIPTVDFEELTVEDVTTLRNAVNETNDWNQIWETEKNSVVDMFGKIMRQNISTGQKSKSNQGGGQDGNQSSLAPATPLVT